MKKTFTRTIMVMMLALFGMGTAMAQEYFMYFGDPYTGNFQVTIERGGTVDVPVYFQADGDGYHSITFDVSLPDGITISSVVIGSGLATTHYVETTIGGADNAIPEGTVRIGVLSNTTGFTDLFGKIAVVTFEASETIVNDDNAKRALIRNTDAASIHGWTSESVQDTNGDYPGAQFTVKTNAAVNAAFGAINERSRKLQDTLDIITPATPAPYLKAVAKVYQTTLEEYIAQAVTETTGLLDRLEALLYDMTPYAGSELETEVTQYLTETTKCEEDIEQDLEDYEDAYDDLFFNIDVVNGTLSIVKQEDGVDASIYDDATTAFAGFATKANAGNYDLTKCLALNAKLLDMAVELKAMQYDNGDANQDGFVSSDDYNDLISKYINLDATKKYDRFEPWQTPAENEFVYTNLKYVAEYFLLDLNKDGVLNQDDADLLKNIIMSKTAHAKYTPDFTEP